MSVSTGGTRKAPTMSRPRSRVCEIQELMKELSHSVSRMSSIGWLGVSRVVGASASAPVSSSQPVPL